MMDLFYTNEHGMFFNRTLLQYIKQGTNAEIMSILEGRNLCYLRDSTGATLLHYAAEYGNTKFAQYLINSGININAKTEAQVTPLIIAIENSREEIVNLLFKSNVEIFITDIDNVRYTLELVLKIFKSSIKAGYEYSRCESFVYQLLVYGDKQIIREVLPSILELHSKSLPIGAYLLEPLFYLSMNTLPNILEELQNYDLDVNANSKYGGTMLHFAAEIGNASSVKFLLDRGANVNALDANTDTPLKRCMLFVYACYVTVKDHERFSSILDCMDILLKHDADPQIIAWNASFSGTTEFQSKYGRKFLMLFESIITRLALREVGGNKVELSTHDVIQSVSRFQSIFSENKLHLEEVKNVYISKNVSLLDFFAEKEKMISRYALNKRLVFNLNNELKRFDKSSYCHRKLHERCSKLNEMVNLREKVAVELDVILTEMCGMSVYNIAEIIVSYVCDDDLYKMIKLHVYE